MAQSDFTNYADIANNAWNDVIIPKVLKKLTKMHSKTAKHNFIKVENDVKTAENKDCNYRDIREKVNMCTIWYMSYITLSIIFSLAIETIMCQCARCFSYELYKSPWICLSNHSKFDINEKGWRAHRITG